MELNGNTFITLFLRLWKTEGTAPCVTVVSARRKREPPFCSQKKKGFLGHVGDVGGNIFYAE